MSRIRKTSEDLLNPERDFFRLVRDYNDGKLTDNRLFYRAVVIAAATFPGELESEPPCPVGSVRARIYTRGLDANIPNDALTVFYPLFPGDIPQPGEHVYVIFEDENFSSGLWVSKIPLYQDVNLANPDENIPTRPRTSADRFEGTQPSSRIPSEAQYRALPTTTQTQEDTIRSFEEQENSIWQNKIVLLVGDSMIEGPPGIQMEREIRNRGGTVIRDGRSGWGVDDWLRGRTPRRQGPKLNELIDQHNPDIVLISLGGNDWSISRREGYPSQVRSLWSAAQTAPTAFWIGPVSSPYPYPDRDDEWRTTFQEGRRRAESTIQSITGDSFIQVSDVTNTREGRRQDGLHFTAQGVPRAYILRVVDR